MIRYSSTFKLFFKVCLSHLIFPTVYRLRTNVEQQYIIFAFADEFLILVNVHIVLRRGDFYSHQSSFQSIQWLEFGTIYTNCPDVMQYTTVLLYLCRIEGKAQAKRDLKICLVWFFLWGARLNVGKGWKGLQLIGGWKGLLVKTSLVWKGVI